MTLVTTKRSKDQLDSSARWFTKCINAALAVVLLAIISMGGSSMARADDEVDDLSFYKLSSNIAAYYGDVMAPSDNAAPTIPEQWKFVVDHDAQGGDVLGFADSAMVKFKRYGTFGMTNNSQSYSYSMLDEHGISGAANARALRNYAHYGATLNQLGLDSTSTNSGFNITRSVGGGVVYILYTLTHSLDKLFNAGFTLLDDLNPFKWLYKGVSATNTKFANGMVNDQDMNSGSSMAPGLSGVAELASDWYKFAQDAGWQISVPMFTMVLILSLMFVKSTKKSTMLKKWAIRVSFILLGVPLMGSLYTAGIAGLQNDTNGNSISSGADKVVASLYVDTGGWVASSRLSPTPTGYDCTVLSWDTKQQAPTAESRAALRRTAMCINASTGRYGTTLTSAAKGSIGATSDAEVSAELNDFNARSDKTDVVNSDGMSSLIKRYMKKDAKISASDFEANTKAKLSGWARGNKERSKLINGWFSSTANSTKLASDSTSFVSNPLLAAGNGATGLTTQDGVPQSARVTFDENGVPIASNKDGLKIVEKEKHIFTTTGITRGDLSCERAGEGARDGAYNIVDGAGKPLACNFSPLTMYNYLNTTFAPDSMTVYSADKSNSGSAREFHNQVNQIGDGVMKPLYWFNAVTLLASYAIIAIGYLFSMIATSIKRSISLILSVPFAVMGSLPGIAKVIIYSLVMLLEILATVCTYLLVQQLLFSLTSVIEIPLANYLSKSGVIGSSIYGAGAVVGGGLTLVMLLLTTILTIMFTAMAMRLRKTVVKAFDDMVTSLVNRFVGVQSTPDLSLGGGAAGNLAAGLGTAGGMALAGKAMTRGDGGSKAKRVASSDNSGRPMDAAASGSQRGDNGSGHNTSGGRGPNGGGGSPSPLTAGGIFSGGAGGFAGAVSSGSVVNNIGGEVDLAGGVTNVSQAGDTAGDATIVGGANIHNAAAVASDRDLAQQVAVNGLSGVPVADSVMNNSVGRTVDTTGGGSRVDESAGFSDSEVASAVVAPMVAGQVMNSVRQSSQGAVASSPTDGMPIDDRQTPPPPAPKVAGKVPPRVARPTGTGPRKAPTARSTGSKPAQRQSGDGKVSVRKSTPVPKSTPTSEPRVSRPSQTKAKIAARPQSVPTATPTSAPPKPKTLGGK